VVIGAAQGILLAASDAPPPAESEVLEPHVSAVRDQLAVREQAEMETAAVPERPSRRVSIMPISGTESVRSLEAERQREKRAIERIRTALRDVEEESRTLARRVDNTFHPYWGSIFKLGVELSSFGDQVENYACLYTTRVSNLLSYSPLHFFRSPRDFMPHELP
jgi:hypothetical protein